LQHDASFVSTTHTAKFKDIKVKPLDDKDDIDVYLSAFERLAEANKWPETDWATRLAAALTGKAREAFTRMPIGDSGDYDKLKEAILQAYNLTPEAYCLKFKSVQKMKSETHRQYAVRVRTLLERWTSGEQVASFESLQDLLIREQMLESYYPNLQMYLKDKNPKTVQELAKFAEHYDQVHQRDRYSNLSGAYSGDNNQKKLSTTDRKDTSYPHKKKNNDSKKSRPRCWKCGNIGHVQNECKQVLSASCDKPRRNIPGTVNGHSVLMLCDSGADGTLVHSRFVAPTDYLDANIRIRLADGRVVQFPMAEVNLTCSLYSGRLLVGVKDTLPEDVALAVDAIPIALKFFDRPKCTSDSFVATRSQVKASRCAEKADHVARGKVKLSDVHLGTEAVPEEAVISKSRVRNDGLESSNASGTTPDGVLTVDESGHKVSDFAEDSSTVDGTILSEHSSSVEQISVHSDQAVGDEDVVSHADSKRPDAVIDIQDINSEILQKLQATDPSLKKVRRLAVRPDKVKSKSVAFFRRNGIYYRKWTPRDLAQQDFGVTQVVVPRGGRNSGQ
jgi:hypothetical protein